MQNLPPNLYKAGQTRELDRLAIEEFGISGNILMERAGDAAFTALRKTWPEAKSVAVFCGSGNNAGDGYVIARLAHEQGIQVDVFQIGDAASLQGDALAALQRMQGVDLTSSGFQQQSLDGYDVIIDALLGTGISGDVRTPYLAAINAINQSSTSVMALDVPSGLNADTGIPCGSAIKADYTISFIGLKQGMLSGYGPEHCGHILFDDLKIPLAVYERVKPTGMRIDYRDYTHLLPARSRVAHKSKYGHVLLVGGNKGMTGAIRLAGEAALRCGAGLVSIATRSRHAAHISSQRAELMSHGIETADALKELSSRATIIAIGPGLGQDAWAKEMLAIAVARNLPLVVDADGLNLLSHVSIERKDWIITPHPGEAANLLHCSSQEIQADRFSAVAALAKKYQATTVLKGAGSLVQDVNSVPGICTAGNPGMASPGMGDVLTGVISALIAQGISLSEAARLGVCLHAEAADLAVRGIGERGLLAGDLMAPLRRLVNPA